MNDSPRVPLVAWGPDRPSELDAYFKLWARTDAGPASYWHSGFVHALLAGRKLVPLLRYSGLFRVFVEPRERAYRATIADAVMFSDAAGTPQARSDKFRNPVTGRSVPVRHFFEGPYTIEATESSEHLVVHSGPAPVIPFRPRRWQLLGSQVVVSRDIYGSTDGIGASAPPTGATVQPMTLATFSAPLEQLRDSRRSGLSSTILSQQFVGPWMPWLDMSEQAGAAVSCGTGQKLEPDLSDLPAAARARLSRVHPSILRSVEHWNEAHR